MKKQTVTFPPRVRFNWGFHDGTLNAEMGWTARWISHYDKSYEAGYWAGMDAYKATGTRPDSSEQAWKQQVSQS